MYSATSGELGIEQAIKYKPDLILLDTNLPRIDGHEVLSMLRSYNVTQYILDIAVSANAMQNDLERGMMSVFNDYITKPIDINDFINKN